MTEITLNATDVDLLLCSPDGESRRLLARVGDIFPLDPSRDLCPGNEVRPSPARPWGLRFLQVPQPRAGRHEGTGQATTGSSNGDGSKPEDWTKD
jgi:hypothetical protein